MKQSAFRFTSMLHTIVLFLSVVFVYGDHSKNCSTYDPCGRYGYCRNTEYGNWTCECKFWWNGTLCDEQTNSGIQVIVLGCLVALLMALFYGLTIARVIRNKKKASKTTVKHPKLVDVALKTTYRSARLSSCIVAFFMVIVTVSALLIKWSIIRSIHNDIVGKYERNESTYFTPNSFCNVIRSEEINLITFPIACFLILVFIIRTKRTSLLRDHCHGYGAPPIPADFLSHIDRKFVAVVFAICSDELLKIIDQTINGGSSSSGGDGVIVTYLKRLLQVLIMGFRYYPILAAAYIHSILTLSMAMLYAWLDYIVSVLTLSMCEPDFYPTYDEYIADTNSMSLKLNYYGTGVNLIVIQLCLDIPRFLCLSYISVKLPMFLIKKIRNRMKTKLNAEEQMIRKLRREQQLLFRIIRPTSIEMLYVRNLFRSVDQRPSSQSLIARLLPKKIYEWRDDFRFSTRILCVYASIFLLLYFVAIQACIRALPYLEILQILFQEVINVITSIRNPNALLYGNQSKFPFPSLVRPYLFAVFITLTIIVIQLLVFLVNLRRNLFQLYRGNATEVPGRLRSRHVSLATGNIHFAGYFIGYLIWGFILIAVFVSILCIIIEAFITYGDVELVEKLLKTIIPSLLFVLFKQYLNKILSQYVFLQHAGDVLSINNRRILMIFIYFNFFLDAFLGFISSIVRLIKSVVAGIVYMCRLDYAPMGRKLETMDGGFSAYCGFVHTECAHRHPVLLVFVAHLYTQYKMKELTMNLNDKKRSRYIRKWKLAVFLTRNPTIVFFRKAFLNQLHFDEIQTLNEEKNLRRKLSIYARRLSDVQSNGNSKDILDHYIRTRF